jgi:hypothetical protein
MSNNVESENFGDLRNTQEALRKFRLKLHTIIDEKCPVYTQITFGNGDAITITFLERAHERVRKATAGCRGSCVRRREMQQLQQRQMQQQQLQPAHEINRQQQMLDETDEFSVTISEDEPDAHPDAYPVPTLATALAGYNVAPAGQNFSPTAGFLHSGPEQGQPRIHNIPAGWPRQGTIAARKENTNNEGHLLKLLMNKMENMNSELSSLQDEHKQLLKTTDKIQCSVKRIREVKEKNVFCWNCELYTGPVHFCESKGKWTHMDRFNRIITFAVTEN